MTTTINTADGAKSPGEALELFKRAKLPAGSLLGIYTQLTNTDRGAEATEFVKKNPTKFSEKIQRMAKEKATGRPIGTKRITSTAQALELLRESGLRPTLQITFRADRPEKVREITSLEGTLIKFYEGNAVMMLIHCVYASGRWEGITRTYTVTVNAVSDEDLEQVAQGFAAALESVELKHNMAERVAVWVGAAENNLLVSRPDVFYDESVFRTVCDVFNRRSEADNWVSKITDPSASMREIIMILPHMFRVAFLEEYFKRFDAVMAQA